MERVMAEATELLVLGVAPALPSSFKVKGHDRVTLDREVGQRETAREARPVESGIPV